MTVKLLIQTSPTLGSSPHRQARVIQVGTDAPSVPSSSKDIASRGRSEAPVLPPSPVKQAANGENHPPSISKAKTILKTSNVINNHDSNGTARV